MVFDTTITLGNLLTAIGMVVAGLMAVMSMRSELQVMNIQVKSMADQLKLMNGVVTDLAVQDKRLEVIEATIEDMRHGRGFTFNLAESRSWSRGPVEPNAPHRRT